nr:hypothetical protein HUO10_000354 [Paraburkholderia busanensis]
MQNIGFPNHRIKSHRCASKLMWPSGIVEGNMPGKPGLPPGKTSALSPSSALNIIMKKVKPQAVEGLCEYNWIKVEKGYNRESWEATNPDYAENLVVYYDSLK